MHNKLVHTTCPPPFKLQKFSACLTISSIITQATYLHPWCFSLSRNSPKVIIMTEDPPVLPVPALLLVRSRPPLPLSLMYSSTRPVVYLSHQVPQPPSCALSISYCPNHLRVLHFTPLITPHSAPTALSPKLHLLYTLLLLSSHHLLIQYTLLG